MSFFEAVQSGFWMMLWFSWVALLFAAIPVGFVALTMRGRGIAWEIPATDGTAARKVHYVLLGLLGGLAGEFVAVGSLAFGIWWACVTGEQVCHDGQAGMVVIFTLPLLSFGGSLIALLWTRASLRIAPERPWASVFCYSGPRRWLNWTIALGVQLLFWSLLTYSFARLNL